MHPPEVLLDFAFTEHDAPDVRKAIESDLGTIARRVAKADPALVALVLTGGFSRGEGTTRHGRPLNDYDLVAVRARPGGGALYSALHRDLTRAVGIEVDLMPIWRARVPRVGRKLFWLDLRLGGRVIAGDEGALDRIPKFAAADLSRLEGPRLLANRAAGLLLAVPGPGQVVDGTLVDLQATKAALAAMDARLLAAGRYAATLRERLELARGMPDHDIYARAVEWKLGGSAGPLGAEWWRACKAALLRALEDTRAEEVRDGLAEVAVHIVRARRLAWQPSRRERREAWRLLRSCEFPDGPPVADWPAARAAFFERRARTLQ